MGMSASQARLLSITARINDLEYKSQSIANVKVRLADESEQLAQNYTQKLNRQKLTFVTYADENNKGMAYKVDLTLDNLEKYGFRLVGMDGKAIDATQYPKLSSADMYAMIESGEFRLEQFTEVKEIPADVPTANRVTWETTDDNGDKITHYAYYRGITASENYNMNTEYDSTLVAQAEAEYNAANMKISKKEKQLDNELKKLDTEHNALQTEADSVKNLIGKNVEKTFNLFA